MPSLRTHHNAEAQFLRFLPRGENRAHPCRVHCHRFFHKDVFLCFYGRGKMRRTKMRRRGQQNDVYIGGDQFFISVKPDEASTVRNLLPPFAQSLASAVKPVLKHISEGSDSNVGRAAEYVLGRARTASAAAHQTRLQGRAFRNGSRCRADPQNSVCRCGRSHRGLDETSSCQFSRDLPAHWHVLLSFSLSWDFSIPGVKR